LGTSFLLAVSVDACEFLPLSAAALKRLLVGALVLPALAIATFVVVVGRDRVWPTLLGEPYRAPVDFATLRPEARPNRFVMCPPGLCPAPDAPSPVFAVPAAALREAWMRVGDRQPHASLLDASADGWQLDYEVRTPMLRFPDAVTVRFLPVGPESSTFAVYSRSHYGYSDLGTNERRVTQWLDAARAELER
jgi:uncharacterized protein (DUF1499 family)